MMKSALEQCRDAILGVIHAKLADGTYADKDCKLSFALAAADAELAARQEPVAWAQLGMRNGHTYVRMNYEGHLYPPPPDVQRNLNLVPLYAAPVAAPVAQPLSDEQIRAIYDEVARRQGPYMGATTRLDIVRAIERAHGIAPKKPA